MSIVVKFTYKGEGNMKKLNKKGFTLIELIVVIAIIAILAAILIPALLDYIEQANVTRAQSDARSLYSAVVLKVATENPAVDHTDTEAWAFVGGAQSNADLDCEFTASGNAVSIFECTQTINGTVYTFSLANNFDGGQ
jgi:prepilin-type N-terminal cleavage/methylation domain-containing protein